MVVVPCSNIGDVTMHHLTVLFHWIRSKFRMCTPDLHADLDDSPTTRNDDAWIGDLVSRGEVVELRRHAPNNRAAFIRWYQDRAIAEVLRHDLEPLTELQARAYFDTIVMPQSSRGTCWAVHLVPSGELVGSTAVTDIDTRHRTCLFRIVIGEKAVWGKGAGTEATRLVIAESFETLDLNEIKLEVFSHNERARRAYVRVGFREIGRHVEWVARHQREINVIEMRLDRATWRQHLTDE